MAGEHYQDHGLLFAGKVIGRRIRIPSLSRFNRLAEAALHHIRLHDVRHGYATAGVSRHQSTESGTRR